MCHVNVIRCLHLTGFSILCPLLQSPYPQLQMKGAELVGELVQNVDHLQESAMRYALFFCTRIV